MCVYANNLEDQKKRLEEKSINTEIIDKITNCKETTVTSFE